MSDVIKKRNIHAFDWVRQNRLEYWEKIDDLWIELEQYNESNLFPDEIKSYHQILSDDDTYMYRLGKHPVDI